ncbi:hypothetical protein [Streptomyces sp. NPDC056672]|uniref:hypothetical protein n=1 Tax=Streptomyces sp. NPDC056672 TaxID=3345906 RepID=UPI0036BD6E1D
MTTIAVRIIYCIHPDELYCRYAGQSEAQPVYIELDVRGGILLADYNPEVSNAVPFSVYHGFERRYGIPVLTAEAANAVMARLAPLADRILADWDEVWDGNNRVAVLGEDATAAEEEIRSILGTGYDSSDDPRQGFGDSEIVAEWDLEGVVNGYEVEEYDVTAGTTDERLEEIEGVILASLAACGMSEVNVCPELAGHLRQLRADADTETAVWVLISASPGDCVPGTEISAPDSPLDWDDLPADARAWATAQGYGNTDGELLYVLSEDDAVPDGYASFHVTVPAAP